MIKTEIINAHRVSSKIAELEQVCFNTDLKRIYDVDKNIKAICKYDGSRLVGMVTTKRHDEMIEIYNLAVDPEYRRRQIGTSLLEVISSFDCSLEVRESNTSAIEFYKHNGFVDSYRRKGYYGNEDALVLERTRRMTDKAYAKVNLVLNVVGKRQDGFHEIEFLMNTLDLHDTVTVVKSEADQVVVIDQPELDGLDNLAYKALEVMRSKYQFKTKYKITIDKHIPVAAGMAGGSSDAAAVLRIINNLEHLNLSNEELALIGSEVGSDVSFCVHSKLAIARGRGEQIELVEADFGQKYVFVINPGVPLSTPEVYKNHTINDVRGDISKLLVATTDLEFESELENSLAVTAKKLCPQIEQLETEIKQLTDHRVIVSGSGPTLLVFSSSKEEIEKLYNHFKPNYQHCHIAVMD